MNFTNAFITLTEQADAEKPSLFPFPYSMHLIFVLISVAFFSYRFIVQKRPYQMIMAAAILASMGVWLSDNRKVYYGVGLVDVILILAALVTAIIFKNPEDSDKKDDDVKPQPKKVVEAVKEEAEEIKEEVTEAVQDTAENVIAETEEAVAAQTDSLTVDQILDSIPQED